MQDPDAAAISGSTPQELFACYKRIIKEFPIELKKKHNSVIIEYIAAYGLEGACERLKGRTASQILEEFQRPPGRTIIESGERDGVRYTLYDAPDSGGDVP